MGHCLLLAGGSVGQGWYLRVGFDFDVVFGDKALAAIQLSLVPVLVIFHVEDLGRERSREASAQLPSPWPPHCPGAAVPHHPQNLGKRGSFEGNAFHCSPEMEVWLTMEVPNIPPNPPAKESGKTHTHRGLAAASSSVPRDSGSVGGRSRCEQEGCDTRFRTAPFSSLPRKGPGAAAQLCKQDLKPWGCGENTPGRQSRGCAWLLVPSVPRLLVGCQRVYRPHGEEQAGGQGARDPGAGLWDQGLF